MPGFPARAALPLCLALFLAGAPVPAVAQGAELMSFEVVEHVVKGS